MLRYLCQKEYGEDFGKMYDLINKGIAIGGFAETIIFINMIDSVKSMYYTGPFFNPFKYILVHLKRCFRKEK